MKTIKVEGLHRFPDAQVISWLHRVGLSCCSLAKSMKSRFSDFYLQLKDELMSKMSLIITEILSKTPFILLFIGDTLVVHHYMNYLHNFNFKMRRMFLQVFVAVEMIHQLTEDVIFCLTVTNSNI